MKSPHELWIHGGWFVWEVFIRLVWTILILAFVLSIFGCTVQPPRPVPVATTPLPVPVAIAEPVATAPPAPPVIEALDEPLAPSVGGPQDPDVIKAMRKHEQTGKFTDISTPGVLWKVVNPSGYTLSCPEQGTLTIRLPVGEILKHVSAGNSLEWQFEWFETGLDLPTWVITVKRGWQVLPTEMTAYMTDGHIHQFLLLPGGPLGNKRTRQLQLYDPKAEFARYQGKVAADERRRKRAQESRLPGLNAEQVREYQMSGDHVAWRPLRVVGDDKHTIVQLPASTGTELPILTVIQDGQEQRVNARTHPPRDGNGPVIVADQAFSEAKLIGEGGAVVITGGPR